MPLVLKNHASAMLVSSLLAGDSPEKVVQLSAGVRNTVFPSLLDAPSIDVNNDLEQNLIDGEGDYNIPYFRAVLKYVGLGGQELSVEQIRQREIVLVYRQSGVDDFDIIREPIPKSWNLEEMIGVSFTLVATAEGLLPAQNKLYGKFIGDDKTEIGTEANEVGKVNAGTVKAKRLEATVEVKGARLSLNDGNSSKSILPSLVVGDDNTSDVFLPDGEGTPNNRVLATRAEIANFSDRKSISIPGVHTVLTDYKVSGGEQGDLIFVLAVSAERVVLASAALQHFKVFRATTNRLEDLTLESTDDFNLDFQQGEIAQENEVSNVKITEIREGFYTFGFDVIAGVTDTYGKMQTILKNLNNQTVTGPAILGTLFIPNIITSLDSPITVYRDHRPTFNEIDWPVNSRWIITEELVEDEIIMDFRDDVWVHIGGGRWRRGAKAGEIALTFSEKTTGTYEINNTAHEFTKLTLEISLLLHIFVGSKILSSITKVRKIEIPTTVISEEQFQITFTASITTFDGIQTENRTVYLRITDITDNIVTVTLDSGGYLINPSLIDVTANFANSG